MDTMNNDKHCAITIRYANYRDNWFFGIKKLSTGEMRWIKENLRMRKKLSTTYPQVIHRLSTGSFRGVMRVKCDFAENIYIHDDDESFRLYIIPLSFRMF